MTISIKCIAKNKLTASLPFALLRDAFGMHSGSRASIASNWPIVMTYVGHK